MEEADHYIEPPEIQMQQFLCCGSWFEKPRPLQPQALREKQAEDKKERSEYPAQAKWAELLKRSFAIEILKCAKCGGKMKLVSIIQDPVVAKRILEAIGLSAEVPLKAAPRAPPTNALNDPNRTLDDYSQLTPNYDAF